VKKRESNVVGVGLALLGLGVIFALFAFTPTASPTPPPLVLDCVYFPFDKPAGPVDMFPGAGAMFPVACNDPTVTAQKYRVVGSAGAEWDCPPEADVVYKPKGLNPVQKVTCLKSVP
jgi:hypothetical protein